MYRNGKHNVQCLGKSSANTKHVRNVDINSCSFCKYPQYYYVITNCESNLRVRRVSTILCFFTRETKKLQVSWDTSSHVIDYFNRFEFDGCHEWEKKRFCCRYNNYDYDYNNVQKQNNNWWVIRIYGRVGTCNTTYTTLSTKRDRSMESSTSCGKR